MSNHHHHHNHNNNNNISRRRGKILKDCLSSTRTTTNTIQNDDQPGANHMQHDDNNDCWMWTMVIVIWSMPMVKSTNPTVWRGDIWVCLLIVTITTITTTMMMLMMMITMKIRNDGGIYHRTSNKVTVDVGARYCGRRYVPDLAALVVGRKMCALTSALPTSFSQIMFSPFLETYRSITIPTMPMERLVNTNTTITIPVNTMMIFVKPIVVYHSIVMNRIPTLNW